MPTLREIRIGKDLSQAQVGELAGTSQDVVSRAELGKPTRKKTLERICKALEVPFEQVQGMRVYSAVRDRNLKKK